MESNALKIPLSDSRFSDFSVKSDIGSRRWFLNTKYHPITDSIFKGAVVPEIKIERQE